MPTTTTYFASMNGTETILTAGSTAAQSRLWWRWTSGIAGVGTWRWRRG